MAREHGLTTKVVRSAREALGVRIERDGFGPGSKSLWSLPDTSIDAQPAHRCPTQGMGKYGDAGQVCSPLGDRRIVSPGADLRLEANRPALGPPGDSLDDLQ